MERGRQKRWIVTALSFYPPTILCGLKVIFLCCINSNIIYKYILCRCNSFSVLKFQVSMWHTVVKRWSELARMTSKFPVAFCIPWLLKCLS